MVKNIETNEDTSYAETVVGPSVKIEGDLVSDGDIKIDGLVNGKVKTSKNLFIGPSAKIEADVQAGSVTVAGSVNGNVKAGDLLVILQTGKVIGDLECRSVAIEEGAYFSGKCSMPTPANGKAKPVPEED